MASITYNNLGSPTNIVTFTDVPNILKVEDSDGGSYATFNFTINSSLKGVTTADGQWYITFLGETISNVLDPDNAVNKNFYISSNNTSTAASMVKAFRNCPGIIANFNVELVDSGGVTGVKLTAKGVGTIWTNMTNYLDTNIENTYMTMNGTDGSASSSLNGALIDVDVYSNDNYITTLEKNWYGGEASFNMSPVLTTISEYGRVVPYNFKISSIKNGEYALLGTVNSNYTTPGYMVNQGSKFLVLSGLQVAQNYSRGASREFDNNTILYVYKPVIDISVYAGNSGGFTQKIEFLDSAFNIIGSSTTQRSIQSYSLIDLQINLNVSGNAYFPLAFYVDVTLGALKVRYNVIKPLKSTEYSQRILWRNSYGGISFFDFTGQRSETRDVDISTYQKNIFDYYTDPMNELEKVYDNEVKYTVTLKSHLFEHDGKYIFNDLIQSGEVWTEINGQNYGIIIDSVSVDETDRNDIYEATVKYHYSQEPSLI